MDFRLYPHKNCDIIKIDWGYLPINMTFYSTKFADSETIKIFRNFYQEHYQIYFHIVGFSKNACFSLIKSFHL